MNPSNFHNTLVGIGSGILGGVGRYYLDISANVDASPPVSHTILTACISALCGLIIKDLYGGIKRKIKK